MVNKIMERESALKVLDEIKNKICDVDLDELCGEETSIKPNGENDEIYKKMIQAAMCGLVRWDDEKNCMVQVLIHPIKSGEVEATELYYKHTITLGVAKGFDAKNQAGLLNESIAHATGRPVQLIEKLYGVDMNIATGCIGFFDK